MRFLNKVAGRIKRMQGRKESGDNLSPTDDGMERPHSTGLFGSTPLSQSPTEPCCFVLIVQSIAHAPYPIDALLKGKRDVLYKQGVFHEGVFPTLKSALGKARIYTREIDEEGRYILQMPCTEDQLPKLVEAGLSRCIAKVHNVTRIGVGGYDGEENINFKQEIVTQALATTESHEAPTSG